MNQAQIGSTLAPMAGLSGTPPNRLQVTTEEADNGFIMRWWTPQDGNRIYLALTLEDVGQKFSEVFGIRFHLWPPQSQFFQ